MNLLWCALVSLGILAPIPMFYFRRTRIAAWISLAISLAAIAHAVYETNRYEKNYGKIENGISEAEVIDLLGNPDWISDGTVSEYGHKRRPERIKEEVKKEYWFYCKYAPEVWNVSFDEVGIVVSTSHLLSP